MGGEEWRCSQILTEGGKREVFEKQNKNAMRYIFHTTKYSIKYLFQVRVLTTGLFSLAFSCCCYSDLNAFMYTSLSLKCSLEAEFKSDGGVLLSTIKMKTRSADVGAYAETEFHNLTG
jgi:hypothetical protein